jgi:hypothetical protein
VYSNTFTFPYHSLHPSFRTRGTQQLEIEFGKLLKEVGLLLGTGLASDKMEVRFSSGSARDLFYYGVKVFAGRK